MEPVTLTLGAIAAAVAGRAGSRAIDVTVEGGEGALRRLVGRLRERFSEVDDAKSLRMLELVEMAPDEPQVVRELAEAVDEHVAADPAFGAELARQIREARASGVNVDAIGQVVYGDHNVQIDHVTASQITIASDLPLQPPKSAA